MLFATVTKTINLHNGNFASKRKRYLKKVTEKYDIEILDNSELSQDVTKLQLQDILAEATPYELKSATASADQQQQQELLWLMPVLRYLQLQLKINLNWRSEPNQKIIKIREAVGEAYKKGKLTYACLIHQIKQVELMSYTHQEVNNTVISSMSRCLAL